MQQLEFLGTLKEVDGYDGICRLSNGLLAQVPVRTYRRAKVGSRAAEAIGDYNLWENPDFKTFGAEETSKPNWKWMTVPIEVEKTRVMSAGKLSDILLKAKEEGEFVLMVRRPLHDYLHLHGY